MRSGEASSVSEIDAAWVVYSTLHEFTRGVAWPSAETRSNAKRNDWTEAGVMPLRSTVVSPPSDSGAESSCAPVVASSTLTTALPVPDPAGEKSELLTTSEPHAVTERPAAAATGLEVALPEVKKLTGACVSRTASRLGDEPGVASRACQRTPWTVRRKLSSSVGEPVATGK